MRSARFLSLALGAALAVFAADAPLPDLRIEPTGGGSIFYVRNDAKQPLTAYLIELVDYPGSNYFYWQDDPADTLAPGKTREIKVANMTVGAVPDQVKVRAAVYADGSTAGLPERIEMLLGRRRAVLETTRELIRRIEKAGSADAAKADLAQWAGSLPPINRARRYAGAGVNQSAAAALIEDTVKALGGGDTAQVLVKLRASERSLAAAKPAL